MAGCCISRMCPSWVRPGCRSLCRASASRGAAAHHRHDQQRGAELAVPYYFNLAPNYDLTLVPKYIARRGLQLGAETVTWARLHRRHQCRGHPGPGLPAPAVIRCPRSTTRPWAPACNWRGTEQGSDNDYPSDFSHSITGSTQRLLQRNVSLTYSSTYWSVTGLVSKYQLLQDVNAPIPSPMTGYRRSPSTAPL
jgi:LPS-assembly protein